MASRFAIIGMEASAGAAEGIDLFDRCLYRGEPRIARESKPASVWLNDVVMRCLAAVSLQSTNVELIVIADADADLSLTDAHFN
jgi:hypothetical protein